MSCNEDFMVDFPQEIIDHIFFFVSWRDMQDCGYVSKLWRERVAVSTAWRNQCIREGHQVTRRVKGEMTRSHYRDLFYKAKYISENLSSEFFEKKPLFEEEISHISILHATFSFSDEHVAYG